MRKKIRSNPSKGEAIKNKKIEIFALILFSLQSVYSYRKNSNYFIHNVLFLEEMYFWMSELMNSRCDCRTAGGLPETAHTDIKFFLKKAFF